MLSKRTKIYKYFCFALLLLEFSCSSSRNFNQVPANSVHQLVEASPIFSQNFTGFALYDPSKAQFLYELVAEYNVLPACINAHPSVVYTQKAALLLLTHLAEGPALPKVSGGLTATLDAIDVTAFLSCYPSWQTLKEKLISAGVPASDVMPEETKAALRDATAIGLFQDPAVCARVVDIKGESHPGLRLWEPFEAKHFGFPADTSFEDMLAYGHQLVDATLELCHELSQQDDCLDAPVEAGKRSVQRPATQAG